MAHSFLSTVADGSTNIFTVDFPYGNKSYVKVYKDGVLVDASTLTWPSSGQVQLPDTAASLAGKTILRQRESPLDALLATFLAGPLDHNALNTVLTQLLHLSVEARDGYSGASVTWAGAWAGTTTYDLNDVVTYSGSSYRSLASSNLNVTPGTDAAKWQLIASKGDVGTTAWGDLTGVPLTFPASSHNHDDRYYTETETDALVVALNAAIALKLALTGGTLTGDATIAKTWPTMFFNKPAAGTGVQIVGRTNGLNRWNLQLGGSGAESGSNAGSDFAIDRYDDAGVSLGTALTVSRATGKVSVAGALDVAGITTHAADTFTNANIGIKLKDTSGVWTGGTTGGTLLQGGGGTLFLDSYGGTVQMRGASYASLGLFTSTLATFNSVKVASFTVAGLPSAATYGAGAIIYVSNETGGATIAFSDGTNWRRVSDRAICA